MSRWFRKRWVWATLTGAVVAAGSAVVAQVSGGMRPAAPRGGPPAAQSAELPKAGDSIAIKFPNQPEKKFSVVRASRKPDGTVETVVKDPANGETFTLVDPVPGARPAAPAPSTGGGLRQPTNGPAPSPPRARPRTSDPLLGTPPAPMPEPPSSRRLFGSRTTPTPTPAAQPAPPQTPPTDPPKKRGLLNRLFGSKKSTPPPANIEPTVTIPASSVPYPPQTRSGRTGTTGSQVMTGHPAPTVPQGMPNRPVPPAPRTFPPTPVNHRAGGPMPPAPPAPLPIPTPPGRPGAPAILSPSVTSKVPPPAPVTPHPVATSPTRAPGATAPVPSSVPGVAGAAPVAPTKAAVSIPAPPTSGVAMPSAPGKPPDGPPQRPVVSVPVPVPVPSPTVAPTPRPATPTPATPVVSGPAPVAPPAPVAVPKPVPAATLTPATPSPVAIPTPRPAPGSAPPAISIPTPTPAPVPTLAPVPTQTLTPTPVPVPTPVPPSALAVPTAPPSGAAAPGRVVWQPNGAIQVVLPAGYVPPELAAIREIEPHVKSLQTSLRPTERMTAVETLAGGRYGTSDGVKSLLFRSAQADPCPMVKACCIEQLTKLGYHDPAFMNHLKTASEDRNEEVRDAAKAALLKLAPQK